MMLTTHLNDWMRAEVTRVNRLLLSEEEKADLVCALATGDGMKRYIDSMRGVETAATLPQLQKEYQEFFLDLLSKHNVASPDKLDGQKKTDFYKEVSEYWLKNKDSETVEKEGDE